MTMRPLTDVEFELMDLLWRKDGATVHEVLEALPPERKLAYTSVSTMLRILEQKGVVRAVKQGRGHRYEPAIDRREYEAFSVKQMVARVFGGEATSLVRCLVETGGLAEGELSSLRAALDAAAPPGKDA